MSQILNDFEQKSLLELVETEGWRMLQEDYPMVLKEFMGKVKISAL